MNSPFLIIATLPLLLSSCTGNDVDYFTITETLEIELHLLKSSIDTIPYSRENEVCFVDSSGANLKFEITRNEHFMSYPEIPSFVYDRETETAKEYYFYEENLIYKLYNDSLNLTFEILLVATPADVSYDNSKGIKDEIYITLMSNSESKQRNVFNDIIDPRNSNTRKPDNQPLDAYDHIEVIEKEFYRVREKEGGGYRTHQVLFNFEVGIVRFEDDNGTLWRFDRFKN